MNKYGYKAQMTFDISDEEKEIAKKAIVYFNKVQNLLNIAINHLDIMYEPFKDYANVKPEELLQNRVILRKYRDQVIDNFNKVKFFALHCVALMNKFSSDSNVSEIMQSFIDSMDDIEKQVNRFAEIFNKLSSKEFPSIATAAIEAIKKQAVQLEQLISDRIFPHIDTNILANNWVNNLSEQLNIDINKTNKPLVQKLWEERKKALEGEPEIIGA